MNPWDIVGWEVAVIIAVTWIAIFAVAFGKK